MIEIPVYFEREIRRDSKFCEANQFLESMLTDFALHLNKPVSYVKISHDMYYVKCIFSEKFSLTVNTRTMKRIDKPSFAK